MFAGADDMDMLTDQPPPRFGELSKLLPVGVVVGTIMFLYIEYVYLHCMRLMQLDLPPRARKMEEVNRACIEMIVFHVLTGLLLYCLGRCILTDAGGIPSDGTWDLKPEFENERNNPGASSRSLKLIEVKQSSGERRHCKWCLKYKPDRCHHCRICNACVLRMDHHCPWVYNCIGFRNHKYFFLLLFYAALDLAFITFMMFDSVWWSTRTDVSIALMLTMASGYAFALFLTVISTTFLGFHTWLMVKAMTTVEFCEKSLKKQGYNSSRYNHGLLTNICSVLGPEPAFWFLPMSLPEGEGISWSVSTQSGADAAQGEATTIHGAG